MYMTRLSLSVLPVIVALSTTSAAQTTLGSALPCIAAMMHPPLYPWQRLSVRMVVAFVLVTVFAIGLAALLMFRGFADVPLLGRLEAVRDFQGLHQVLEEVVSAKVLNLARTGVLLIDAAAHAEAQRTLDPGIRGVSARARGTGLDPAGE